MVADPATYYTGAEFMDFLARSGVGLTCTPALMGAEEGAIGIAKRIVLKLQKENNQWDIHMLFDMVTHAMNSHIGSSGFSAYQWVYGKDHHSEPLPDGLEASKAFGGLMKARERAKLEYDKEKARDKFSKLANSVGRPTMKAHTGQLVMLWRQKVKPGKVKGSWVGPVLVEGSTIWLATGSTLVRAKLSQLRPVTKREELQSTLEGTAIYRTPVTTETLMRAFQGRYYLDVSGDVPSEQQLQQDLSPAEVQLPPKPGQPRPDAWTVREEDGRKTLVRVHNMPRLALFSPTKVTTCPVSLDELTGHQTTIVRPLHGGPEAKIKDDISIQRNLQDRWIGETQFEMKMGPRPLKVRRSTPKTGQKRPPDKEPQELRRETDGPEIDGEQVQPDDPQQGLDEDLGQDQPTAGGDDALPHEEEQQAAGAEVPGLPIPPSNLNEALLRHGSDAVDGLPVQLHGNSVSNQCPAPGCELPGGHAGVHEGPEGKFLYDNYEGRKLITEEKESDDSVTSQSSISSEELLHDEDLQGLVAADDLPVQQDTFMAAEVDGWWHNTLPNSTIFSPPSKATIITVAAVT